MMEESDLLKERLQAITEKHRVQEVIRQKKVELDCEKLKLQHLKKKALREQWLLQDSASHNAANSPRQQSLLSDQQQTRVLQFNIHRMEKEVESLEREESMISINESFILNRLKAVEKSSEDIIKEAQESFVPEPLQIATVIPDAPESLSPPAKKHFEPNAPRNTLFAMEINVTKNLLTGESTVLSTAAVPPEELNQHAGLKVYDDGRKCVYALNPQEGSPDQNGASELSASEVQQLLRSATIHRQNYRQNHGRREEKRSYNQQHDRDDEEGRNLRHQERRPANRLFRNNTLEKNFSCRENWQGKLLAERHCGHQENSYGRLEERHNQSNLREGHRLGNHRGLGHLYSNQKDGHYSSYQVRDCHSVQEHRPPGHHANGITRSSSLLNGGRANGYPPLRSHEREIVSAYQSQLCYTPASYIPLRDYISVDEEELYCLSPPSHHCDDGNPPAALYGGSAHADRVPSPLYGDDTPYTILNAMETTEPITAIFMGFQMAQDDSGQCQEFDGSLKAELVIIEDNEDGADGGMKDKKHHRSPLPGSSANGKMAEGVGGGKTERRVGAGVKEED